MGTRVASLAELQPQDCSELGAYKGTQEKARLLLSMARPSMRPHASLNGSRSGVDTL